MASKKRTPNLEGLSDTFEVEVGSRKVTCAWIPRDYFERGPTNQEVIDEIARRHLRSPRLDVAEAAFEAKKAEMTTHYSVAIDDRVEPDSYGRPHVGCVHERRRGRYSGFINLHHKWVRRYRFLVVVPE